MRVAAAPEARGAGAVVAMGDEIHAARWVRKLHSAGPAAFASPGRGPIGRVTPASLELPWLPPRGYTIDPPAELSRPVPLIGVYPAGKIRG